MIQTPIFYSDIFPTINQLLQSQSYYPIFILVDENTHEHCLPLFLSELETEIPIEIIEIPAGEENKTIEIGIQLWQSMNELNGSKKSLLINLGGGMITDLGGFVASTFKRGIDFINVPTTLLSMVDAAIGGKTGIDLDGIKNNIGTFSLPISTFIDSRFLESLPKRELKSGMAEMLKHGLIQDRNHWRKIIQLTDYSIDGLSDLIQESTEIKIKIINSDPKESGLRKILNFGHTIGHAVESEFLKTDNYLLHGEAIAIGILVESILSYENELINKIEMDEIFQAIVSIYGKFLIPEKLIPDLIDWMRHDKKNQNQQIGFSLLNGIGNCKFDIYLNEDQIIAAILQYNQKIETI